MGSQRQRRFIGIVAALAVMLTGGLRQAPVNAHTNTPPKVQIGTACTLERGGPQICK